MTEYPQRGVCHSGGSPRSRRGRALGTRLRGCARGTTRTRAPPCLGNRVCSRGMVLRRARRRRTCERTPAWSCRLASVLPRRPVEEQSYRAAVVRAAAAVAADERRAGGGGRDCCGRDEGAHRGVASRSREHGQRARGAVRRRGCARGGRRRGCPGCNARVRDAAGVLLPAWSHGSFLLRAAAATVVARLSRRATLRCSAASTCTRVPKGSTHTQGQQQAPRPRSQSWSALFRSTLFRSASFIIEQLRAGRTGFSRTGAQPSISFAESV